MKVVLFCGGYGMRMRQHPDNIPKPMQMVGPRPLIWHVMRYYAHYGHKDFMPVPRLRRSPSRTTSSPTRNSGSNDLRACDGGRGRAPIRDQRDWRITFVDTGIWRQIGERLRRVRDYVRDEECFLANYADGLTMRRWMRWLRRSRRAGDRLLPGLQLPAPAHISPRRHRPRRQGEGIAPPIVLRSGSTAATSSSGARSSTTSRKARSSCSSRSPG